MSPTYDDLIRPLPAWNPASWYYACARGALRYGAKLSKGLAIGQRHGFDSGVMLDHVYENRAEGYGPIGRAIDRFYLNAVGWRGIRNRGALMQETIVREARAMAITCAASDEPVRLADLACGGGRYALGALAELEDVPVNAVFRDYEITNVDAATGNAQSLGVTARIETGDAFSDKALEPLVGSDLVIVSGLHEIVPDDRTVRRHFGQVARILKPGGRLIVTIQPNHPQLQFIARVLKSHTGKPWAMRLRPVEQTWDWLKQAGFRVVSQSMEPTGIFGVIVAEKQGRGRACPTSPQPASGFPAGHRRYRRTGA
jgi:SAM-dependent methyltransferase